MLEALNDSRVLSRVSAYFDILKRTGYVKQNTTSRYLLYMFLYDFVDVMRPCITEEDYNLINKLLTSIFSDGICLLPYKTYCGANAHVGEPCCENNTETEEDCNCMGGTN